MLLCIRIIAIYMIPRASTICLVDSVRFNVHECRVSNLVVHVPQHGDQQRQRHAYWHFPSEIGHTSEVSALLLHLVFLVVIAYRAIRLAPRFTHSILHLLRCHIRVEMSNMSKLQPVCAGSKNFLTTSEAPPNFCTLHSDYFNQYTLERGE